MKKEVVDISNLSQCIENAKQAVLEGDPGPQDPVNYGQLRERLESTQNNLPPLYRTEFYEPFIRQINIMGESGFTSILVSDPTKEREAGLLLDIAHAIIQNGEGYNWLATDSFQEAVSDLYDGFLSEG
jgi:hypothetical protein